MDVFASRPRAPSLIVAALGLGQIVAFASSFYLMGVLGDPIAHDLETSSAVVFATVSLALLVPAAISPAIARRIDRRGGKSVLLSSSAIFALGLSLLAIAHHPLVLALAMAVMGVGMSLGLTPTPAAILVSLYAGDARRPIIGVSLIGGLGSTLGWPITGWMAEQLGWRGACLAWAGAHLLVLPMVALVCPRTPGQAATGGSAHGEVRWDRPMVQLAVLFGCAWFISTCMSTHLPRLFTHFGLSLRDAATAAGLVGVAAVSVRFLEFTVLRKSPPLVTARVATLMHPVGAAALLALGKAGAPFMALGQGAGNGMLTVAKAVLPLSLYGARDYAYRSAILSRPAILAQAAGPTLFAVALEHSAGLAIAGTSALCLVMFAMTFGLRRSSPPVRQELIA